MKKRLRFAIMILVLSISFYSNAEDATPVIESQSEADGIKTVFTKQELLEDYDQLWNDLGEYYPFFPVLEEEGIDLEQLYQKGREQIESRVSDPQGLMFVLKSVFGQMRGFAHLQVADQNTVNALKYAYQQGEMQFEPWYSIIQKPQVQAIYGRMTDAENRSEMQGGFAADESGLPDAQDRFTVDASYIPDLKTVYYHFKSFDTSFMERDRNMIHDHLESLGNVPIEHVIIDVTGNAGGNTEYWKENIVGLFPGDYLWESYVFYNDTEINRYFYKDMLDYTPISEFPEHKKLPAFVDWLQLSYFTKIEDVIGQDEASLESRLADAKRWVLIDQNGYSATECFAYFCKEAQWATLVGRATRGDGIGGNPVFLELKNTGVLIYFSSLAGAGSDGTLNTQRGTAPDIYCKQGESPYHTCIRMIEAEKSYD